MPLFNEPKFLASLASFVTGPLGAITRKSVHRGLLCSTTLVSLLLTGCAQNNPAARQKTLEKFCTSVAQHILDRNPDTISESLSTLYHEELADATRQKLEDTKVIPDSPITVLRWKADWTKAHKSNRVDVGIVRAITPLEAKDVTFKVSGKDWDLVDGKQTDFHPFQFTIIAELTPEMDSMPRALEIQGLGPGGSPNAVASDSSSDSSKPTGKRKHRH